MNSKDYINDQLKIRFSQALYHSSGRGSVYHFLYGYKRILIEIFKSTFYLVGYFLIRVGSFKSIGSIGLYSTKNQRVALGNASRFKLIESVNIPIYSLSYSFNLLRLIYWLVAAFVFPFVFFFHKDKASSNERVFISFRVFYVRMLLNKLINCQMDSVYVSNDHVGDIFLLTILLRDFRSIKVGYVQHGAVKKSFPNNYFDEIVLYDEVYKNIYMELSLNPDVKIILSPDLKGVDKTYLKESGEVHKKDMSLVCLSHSFRIINIFKTIDVVYKNTENVRIRFHPSDRLYCLKFFLLKLFFWKISISDSSIHYSVDFNRSSIVLCASSSILLDVLNNNLDENVYWFKSIGLEWDYYNLEDKFKVINDFCELKKLCSNFSCYEN